ncbi:MAG: type II secretion system GspH family protein [Verrucomicrobiae bacterium]|nr:type II secretion system GspH family protein [Verrucomicrobiae bacterium]NNJ43581.1 type II secretion system protein [Akkermansiaceae bacterium]
MKHHTPQSRPPFWVAPAFTLVELLVVIAIISVMLTMGTLGLKNLSKASGVSAGLPIAEAIFAEARAMAVGKGVRTRVLVHGQNDRDDEFHRERFLRYMVVQYVSDDKDTPDDLDDDEWTTASRGSSLPKGVYFIKRLSETSAITLETVSVELPGKSETTCYVYEYNAEGMIASPEADGNDVPRFVVQAATLPPGADEPVATSGNAKNLGGFVIWRSGRTSLFRHPEQIEPSS